MSAFINPPKGSLLLVYEVCPEDGLRFLTVVHRSTKRSKVIVRAKVQPVRKTRGDHFLVIQCAPAYPTRAAINHFAKAYTEAIRRVAERVEVTLAPAVGKPLNGGTSSEVLNRLRLVLPPIAHKIVIPEHYREVAWQDAERDGVDVERSHSCHKEGGQ